MSNLLCDTFYGKKIPNDIAGTLRGIYMTFGQMGTLTLTIAAGIMIDKYGPASPFILVGILDACLSIIVLIFTLCGKMDID
jgi:sugar phosphate permease